MWNGQKSNIREIFAWPVLVFMDWAETFNILEFCTGKQFATQVIKYVFVKELAPDCAYFCQS